MVSLILRVFSEAAAAYIYSILLKYKNKPIGDSANPSNNNSRGSRSAVEKLDPAVK